MPKEPSLDVNEKDVAKLEELLNNAKRGEVIDFKGKKILKEFGDYLVIYLKDHFNTVRRSSEK